MLSNKATSSGKNSRPHSFDGGFLERAAQGVLGVEPGVGGKFVSLGIAGTLSAGAGASAGRDELDARAFAGVGAPALVLPRDDGLS
jgi:hypothetical protein